jgi:hypothetical protein
VESVDALGQYLINKFLPEGPTQAVGKNMNKPTIRKLLLIMLAVWAVAMVSMSPLFVKGWKHKKALDQTLSSYANALVKGDFATAYGYCSAEFKSSTTFEQFVSQQQELRSAYGGLNSFMLEETEVHGHGATPNWTASAFKYSGKNVSLIYLFHLENGTWRVFGYKTA